MKKPGSQKRICIICGKDFFAYPSDNTVTCSKACQKERMRRITIARWEKHPMGVNWADEAKKQGWKDSPAVQKAQAEFREKGIEAIKKDPRLGRFETNRMAKVWELIDPDGNKYIVRNLLKWCRENAELFGMPNNDDKAAFNIASGFRAISQTLRGVRKTPSMYYKGWTLAAPPRDVTEEDNKEEEPYEP